MKNIHSIVFAIATIAFMFVGFTGCDNKTPPLSITYTRVEKFVDWGGEEYPEGVEITLINRSGTETLVLRTDTEKEPIILQPGESHIIPRYAKGASFEIHADGYRKVIKGTTPTSFD